MLNKLLLNQQKSKDLYDYANNLSIIDYHNHLSINEIIENKRFLDIYDLWIKPDPYKHRAMRMCGVEEKFITGESTNEEKFVKWCETIPKLIGNPLYLWSIMELNSIVNIDKLPKTVLFTLNPADNALMSVLSGSYSKDGVKGLITQGPAWWWCDHKNGIENMLENASAFSVLSNFIGMTTDSRSFLSFVRHDFFRRILCNWITEKITKGEFIDFDKQIKKLIYDLCYGNAMKITV